MMRIPNSAQGWNVAGVAQVPFAIQTPINFFVPVAQNMAPLVQIGSQAVGRLFRNTANNVKRNWNLVVHNVPAKEPDASVESCTRHQQMYHQQVKKRLYHTASDGSLGLKHGEEILDFYRGWEQELAKPEAEQEWTPIVEKYKLAQGKDCWSAAEKGFKSFGRNMQWSGVAPNVIGLLAAVPAIAIIAASGGTAILPAAIVGLVSTLGSTAMIPKWSAELHLKIIVCADLLRDGTFKATPIGDELLPARTELIEQASELLRQCLPLLSDSEGTLPASLKQPYKPRQFKKMAHKLMKNGFQLDTEQKKQLQSIRSELQEIKSKLAIHDTNDKATQAGVQRGILLRLGKALPDTMSGLIEGAVNGAMDSHLPFGTLIRLTDFLVSSLLLVSDIGAPADEIKKNDAAIEAWLKSGKLLALRRSGHEEVATADLSVEDIDLELFSNTLAPRLEIVMEQVKYQFEANILKTQEKLAIHLGMGPAELILLDKLDEQSKENEELAIKSDEVKSRQEELNSKAGFTMSPEHSDELSALEMLHTLAQKTEAIELSPSMQDACSSLSFEHLEYFRLKTKLNRPGCMQDRHYVLQDKLHSTCSMQQINELKDSYEVYCLAGKAITENDTLLKELQKKLEDTGNADAKALHKAIKFLKKDRHRSQKDINKVVKISNKVLKKAGLTESQNYTSEDIFDYFGRRAQLPISASWEELHKFRDMKQKLQQALTPLNGSSPDYEQVYEAWCQLQSVSPGDQTRFQELRKEAASQLDPQIKTLAATCEQFAKKTQLFLTLNVEDQQTLRHLQPCDTERQFNMYAHFRSRWIVQHADTELAEQAWTTLCSNSEALDLGEYGEWKDNATFLKQPPYLSVDMAETYRIYENKHQQAKASLPAGDEEYIVLNNLLMQQKNDLQCLEEGMQEQNTDESNGKGWGHISKEGKEVLNFSMQANKKSELITVGRRTAQAKWIAEELIPQIVQRYISPFQLLVAGSPAPLVAGSTVSLIKATGEHIGMGAPVAIASVSYALQVWMGMSLPAFMNYKYTVRKKLLADIRNGTFEYRDQRGPEYWGRVLSDVAGGIFTVLSREKSKVKAIERNIHSVDSIIDTSLEEDLVPSEKT